MELAAEKVPGIEKEITLETVLEHVQAETVPATTGRRCVDGRYGRGEEIGRLARPGGDFGYVMALLKVNREKSLGLTPQQCVDAVHKAVAPDGGKFFMHTDDHESHTHTIGCGHIAGAVNDGDIAEALAYVLQKGDALRLVRLKGQHAERAVLKILGLKKTVNSQGKDMFFIYDAERDKKFIRQLVSRMNIPNLTASDLQKTADEQTNATLQRLALGQPIYEINADDDEPTIAFAGHVAAPPLNQAA